MNKFQFSLVVMRGNVLNSLYCRVDQKNSEIAVILFMLIGIKINILGFN